MNAGKCLFLSVVSIVAFQLQNVQKLDILHFLEYILNT